MFGANPDSSKKYSGKIEAPIYEPKKQRPHPFECFDKTTTLRLIAEIEQSGVSSEERKLLIEAAHRHTVFNYEKMADYYAHASEEMQKLMEASALVIIDFDQAIERGFVRVCQEIENQYREEYVDAK